MNVEILRATIDPQTKKLFQEKCKKQGKTMTQVIDDFINNFVADEKASS